MSADMDSAPAAMPRLKVSTNPVGATLWLYVALSVTMPRVRAEPLPRSETNPATASEDVGCGVAGLLGCGALAGIGAAKKSATASCFAFVF